MPYCDGRPDAALRMPARDHGIVLKHGLHPRGVDKWGARDMWVFRDGDTWHMFHDGASGQGWIGCHATSKDLVNWERHGAHMEFGAPGDADSAYAGYGGTILHDGIWHYFYVCCRQTSGPGKVPAMPYLTRKAEALTPWGPWRKKPGLDPLPLKPGSYYADTANPGHIVRHGDEWLMFFSAAIFHGRGILRSLGIARTRDLDGGWTPDPEPLVPMTEQIENASLYFEPTNGHWFLFTNHVGVTPQDGEFRDAVWCYWTEDLDRWDPARKAVVVDGKNCTWSRRSIGMAAACPMGSRLGIVYDASGGDSVDNMNNDIGLAWLDLPLQPPA